MNLQQLSSLALSMALLFSACETESTISTSIDDYTGTASVSQGFASITTNNLYPNGGRVAALGSITAADNTVWTVPADVNYTNTTIPFAPDLYNDDGTKYSSANDANTMFDANNIIEVNANGDVITGYIFADNYFELYVNGIAIGKDAIPFTSFNSHIVKFRVSRPYTIAMLLVDWEENLGLGSESNQGSNYHAGDGGMVAVFTDATGNIVATTGSEWKAQTFYTAPIKDLSCPTENGTTRSTANCDAQSASDGSNFYALHWPIPADWMKENYDDTAWPAATTYTNTQIGVNNKSSYTNFTDIFDNTANDAEFIWSTNVVLDNEVIVRYTVQ